jgi:ribosomal protein L37AE/L43A
MPKREDEYWAGMKEPKGRGLCPFCGSSNISYNKRFHSWRCNRCERSFPIPSYGPGKDFGKEARWFGKKTGGRRRAEFARASRKTSAKRGKYHPRRRKTKGFPGWLKPILVITFLAMFGVVVWGLFGNEIADFFRNTTTGSPTGDSELPPEELVDATDNLTDTSDTGEQTSEDNGIEQGNIIGDYYLGLVHTTEGVLSGSECYGEFIVLINNEKAADPSYNQLITFLQQDRTDRFPYYPTLYVLDFYYGTAESHIDLEHINDIISGSSQPSDPRICADFAERLHNEAEMAGIRCAYVSVNLSGYSDPFDYGIPYNTSHALNAFQTTDRGLIYIDDTGKVGGFGPSNCDKTVDIQLGQQYSPISLFPELGWSYIWGSMGTVTDILIIWDGEWND